MTDAFEPTGISSGPVRVYRDGTPEMRALADYMSDISEDQWFAGWMMGLEYALWEVHEGTRVEYGMGDVPLAARDKLIALSKACGGWIYWSEAQDPEMREGVEVGETWVPIERWKDMVAARGRI